jgi:hypothetical protein
MGASRAFILHEPLSLNSAEHTPFERRQSRMSFERHFCGFFGLFRRQVTLSQKPSFLRGKANEQNC